MSEETKEVKEEEKIDEVKTESNDNIEKTTTVVEKEEVKEEAKEREEEKPQKKSIAREIMEWIICIVVAFTLAVIIKYFVFTPTLVKMSSMYPTIFDGDRVYVNRLVRTFKTKLNRGDIVTLEAPRQKVSGENIALYPEYKGMKKFTYEVLEIDKVSYIKRVIGISGDTIKIENDKVFLNGKELDESAYLPDGTQTNFKSTPYVHVDTEFTVPAGYVFVMGDNRTSSNDGRQFGCIPIEKVEGKVLFKIWPLNRIGAITKSDITYDEVIDYNNKQYNK